MTGWSAIRQAPLMLDRPRLASLILALALTSCAYDGRTALPEPVAKDGVTTTFAGFSVDRRSRQTKYAVEYEFDVPVPAGTILRSEFENPLDPKAPLVVTAEIAEAVSSYSVESPPLPAVQNGGVYEVVLVGLSSETREVLFRHVQEVTFVLPPGP